MTDLLASLVDRYASQMEAAQLELEVAPIPVAADKLRVKGDSVSLLQAFGKVMQNAIKFTPTGGTVTLAVGMAESKGRVWTTLSVVDTGPGIPAEELDKIFDRFFQGSVAESGQIPGTGLGLSYAQGVIKAHSGQLTVESLVDEGSTFTAWLPLAI
jgi:signal transduction histidine kinase